MYIKKIILKGYKRFFLSGIDRLEFTPDKRIQVIIGRGGSGKSSLLSELSPLPSNLKKDFHIDGFKRIEISYNNVNYVISSGEIEPGKHSFIRNGEELNKGGTKRVQLTLVKDYFNLDTETHDILLGKKTLTQMLPTQRKSWFTDISTVDFTYGLGVYIRAKTASRDMIGAMKLAKGELSGLMATRENNSTIDDDRLELRRLKDYINTVSSMKVNISDTIPDNPNIEAILTKGEELLRKLNKPDMLRGRDVNVLSTELETKRLMLVTERDTVKNNLTNISKVEGLDIVKELKDVDNELLKISDSIEYLEKGVTIYRLINKNRVGEIIDSFNSVYPLLQHHIGAVIELEGGITTNYTLTEAIRHRKWLKEAYTKLSSELDHITFTIGEINKAMSDDCPAYAECLGKRFNVKDINTLKNLSEATTDKIEAFDLELKNIEYDIETLTSRDSSLNNIGDIISRSNSALKPLLWHIVESNVAREMLERGTTVREEIATLSEVVKLNKLNDEYNGRRAILLDKKKITDKYFNLNKSSLEERYSDLSVKISAIDRDIDYIKQYTKQVSVIRSISDMLKRYIKANYTNLNTSIKVAYNTHINELIANTNVSIGKIESRLIEAEYLSRNIKDLENKIKTLESRKIALDYIINGLSPSGGLLAKSITGFINHFIYEVNIVIGEVWSYPMVLLPVEITDESDIDYKIAVKVDNRDVIEDVSKTSSSMKEMIDLAFKIVSMKYLNMNGYPLYLDEFAKSFDGHHAIRAYDVLESLNNSAFDQIFMITHSETTWSRYGNKADISVLDNNNITLSDKVNINTVLKK